MLYITKIIEGGIDLVTQQELPRSLVVSNGSREITIPVNDNVIRDVVELFADNGAATAPEDVGEVFAHHGPTGMAASGGTTVKRPPPSPQPVNQTPSPFEEEEEEPQMPFDEDGFEPGEEFNDGGTGAGSL